MFNLFKNKKSTLLIITFICALVFILTENQETFLECIVTRKHLCILQKLTGLVSLKGQLKQHFRFPVPSWNYSETCNIRPELWDCVGEDRNWSLVFVDNRPGSKRGPNGLRLISRTRVLVAHDTIQDDAIWPQDWVRTRKGDNPVWAGRRVFTDQGWPWTSLIQGDLDESGGVFNDVVKIFNETVKVEAYWKEFNPTSSGWGSHVKLLAAAALGTEGDVLELGTGHFSTPLLHRIVEGQEKPRMIISADTDATWLPLFSNLSSAFHQILLVPVYSDGGTCEKINGTRQARPEVQDLAFAGEPRPELNGNSEIRCPE